MSHTKAIQKEKGLIFSRWSCICEVLYHLHRMSFCRYRYPVRWALFLPHRVWEWLWSAPPLQRVVTMVFHCKTECCGREIFSVSDFNSSIKMLSVVSRESTGLCLSCAKSREGEAQRTKLTQEFVDSATNWWVRTLTQIPEKVQYKVF